MITHYSSIFFHFFVICSLCDDEFLMPMSRTARRLSGTLLAVVFGLCISGNIIFSFYDWQFSSSCSNICFISIAGCSRRCWFDLCARISLFGLDWIVLEKYNHYIHYITSSIFNQRATVAAAPATIIQPAFNSNLKLKLAVFRIIYVHLFYFSFQFRTNNRILFLISMKKR